MIRLRIRVIGLGPTIQVLGFRIRVLGAMVGLNTPGDMQVRFKVGSDHPSDWIQDPSAWSHPNIRVIGFRIRVLGAMIGMNTVGDMQVRFQVGVDHPSDGNQHPSAWSHGWIVDPTIRVIGCNRKLNQASYWKEDLVHLPSKSKIDLARIRVRNSELMQKIS